MENRDLEYLLPNFDINTATNNISAAYQTGSDPSTIGPIVLTTPKDYSSSESPTNNPNATCWEILTLQLGRFAREYIDKHGAGTLDLILCIFDALLDGIAHTYKHGHQLGCIDVGT